MRELVGSLRHADQHSQQRVIGSRIFGEAADAIERLQAENERLREALREIRDADQVEMALDPEWPSRIARAALSPAP